MHFNKRLLTLGEIRKLGHAWVMIRRATLNDIARLQEIRAGVRENVLRNPGSVTAADYRWFVSNPGIFVWEENERIVGFAAADHRDGSIWALFVDPNDEGRGIGQALFKCVVDALKQAGCQRAWLTTSPQTRAEAFYRKAGWQAVGTRNGETVFELIF